MTAPKDVVASAAHDQLCAAQADAENEDERVTCVRVISVSTPDRVNAAACRLARMSVGVCVVQRPAVVL